MEKRYKIYMMAALALTVLAGCAREEEGTFTTGSPILHASIESGDDTRVSFDNAMGKFEWDQGDQIAVYVGSAFETVTVDYTTGAFRVEGTGDRSFYAVYPATAAPASNSSLTVKLPATYNLTAANVADYDYSPVPMVAENPQRVDELYFRHVGGLVRVFCNNLSAAPSRAVVTFDKDVTGTYAVDTTDPSAPTITTNGDAENNVVTFNLPPQAQATTFVLNVPVPCGTYQSIKLKLDSDAEIQLNDGPVVIARRYGRRLVPFGPYEYIVSGRPDTEEGLHDVVAEYLGGRKELAAEFFSYRYDEFGAVSAVPFEFEFSETGEDGTWTTTPPAWLSVADGVDYSGSTSGEHVAVLITPQEDSATDYHALALAAATPVSDFDLSLYNVATGVIETDPTKQTTANSYVVHAPGSYKFPLVYGNALKNGETNELAFHSKDADGNWRDADVTQHTSSSTETGERDRGWLGYYNDHLDNKITSPYIRTQLHPAEGADPVYSAVILWQSKGPWNSGLVSNVNIDGDYFTFDVSAETIAQGSALVALLADDQIAWSWHIWITDNDLSSVQGPGGFKFSPENIGWYDSRDEVRYDERTYYVRAKQTDNNTSDGTPHVQYSDPVSVKSNAGSIIVHGGSGLKYQHGRKDPFAGTYLRTTGTADPVPQAQSFYANSSYPIGRSSKKVTLGESIRRPCRQFLAPDQSQQWSDYCWRNGWNSRSNIDADNKAQEPFWTKTIYDPSPVGYMVPTYKAYVSLDETNFPYTYSDDYAINGRQYGDDLFIPYTPIAGSKDIGANYQTSDYRNRTYPYTFYWTSNYIYSTGGNTEFTGLYTIRPITEE